MRKAVVEFQAIRNTKELAVQGKQAIVFKGIDPSDTLRRAIEERVAWLERFYNRIVSCRVVVERPQHRHQQGDLFNLRIHLGVPGQEIVVDHAPSDQHEHEDPYVTVHDAFDKARRRLEDYARRQRGDVKHHAPSRKTSKG